MLNNTLVLYVSESFGFWLKDILKKSGWSQGELARQTGYTPAVVSSWVNDRHIPNRRSVTAIAEAFDIPEAEVLEAAGYEVEPIETISPESLEAIAETAHRSMVQLQRTIDNVVSGLADVPLLGRVPADSLRWIAGDDVIERLPKILIRDLEDPVVVYASGDCLAEDGIENGDLVIIDRGAQPSTDGECVLVRIADEFTLKKIYFIDGGVELRASTDAYEPIYISFDNGDAEIIGVAVESFHRNNLRMR